jgi:hypothetical protein
VRTPGGTESRSISISCDEFGNSVPDFITLNLLGCACSLPQLSHEEPPIELDHLLRGAINPLKRQWLRENNGALAALADSTAALIEALEDQAKRRIDGINREIAELRRRRRMPGVTLEAQRIFTDVISDLDREQDLVMVQLAVERERLRGEVEAEERRLLLRTEIRIVVEPLYFVNWHGRPLCGWIEVGYRDAVTGGTTLTDYLPAI